MALMRALKIAIKTTVKMAIRWHSKYVDGDCTVVVEACLMVILVLQRERNEKQKMKSNFCIYFKNASSG